ncbi:MAG: HPP family protein [Methylophaga sp.]|nr:HPP family protein [Methylophaga sp.]
MTQLSLLQRWQQRFVANHASFSEKCMAAAGALLAIAGLMALINGLDLSSANRLLILASMGASTFLLFVVPHSPMAQPWPLVGGHLTAAAIAVICAQLLPSPLWATALAVGLSVFVMHLLHCLHPPAAATAMIGVLGGEAITQSGFAFVYEVVLANCGFLLLLALIINNLLPGRRYPWRQQHHSHHQQFNPAQHPQALALNKDDFRKALDSIDAVIDISETDLVDLYEFAIEHAENRLKRSK